MPKGWSRLPISSRRLQIPTKMWRNLYLAILLVIAAACVNEKVDRDSEEATSDTITKSKEETGIESETEQLFSIWEAGQTVSLRQIDEYGADRFFVADTIPDNVFERMKGVSFDMAGVIKRGDLRYLRVVHHDGQGTVKQGEIICNARVADDLLEIFRTFYERGYAIQSIRLIDEYGGDDEASMADNNTSCFNYRQSAAAGKLSRHAYGMAIDINPLYNPYFKSKTGKILPPEGAPYLERRKDFLYKIDRKDLAYIEFTKRGFRWGGDWNYTKDYQHFEK